jgi:hypothetical protein
LKKNERGHDYQGSFVHLTNGHLASSNKAVTKIGCGGDFTMMYIENDLEVVGMGVPERGQLFGIGPSGHSSRFVVPTLLPYFMKDRREVLQISAGFKISGLLMKNCFQPSSLRKLCSEVIRKNPELSALIAEQPKNEMDPIGRNIDLDEAQQISDQQYIEAVRSNLC